MRNTTYLSKLKYIAERKTAILTHSLESGLVTILWSNGIDPLRFWSREAGNGCIKRITSATIEGLVIEMTSPAFCRTSICLPEDPRHKIGTSMPVLNLILENLNMPFCFEFQVRDGMNMKRRYRMSTCQHHIKLSPLFCHMPLKLNKGWNKIQVDFLALTRWSYGSCYAELLGLQIYANCRIRRVFFSDKTYQEIELPDDYRLREPRQRYLPLGLGRDVP